MRAQLLYAAALFEKGRGRNFAVLKSHLQFETSSRALLIFRIPPQSRPEAALYEMEDCRMGARSPRWSRPCILLKAASLRAAALIAPRQAPCLLRFFRGQGADLLPMRSVLLHSPPTADSASYCVLSCQPGPMPRPLLGASDGVSHARIFPEAARLRAGKVILGNSLVGESATASQSGAQTLN